MLVADAGEGPPARVIEQVAAVSEPLPWRHLSSLFEVFVIQLRNEFIERHDCNIVPRLVRYRRAAFITISIDLPLLRRMHDEELIRRIIVAMNSLDFGTHATSKGWRACVGELYKTRATSHGRRTT